MKSAAPNGAFWNLWRQEKANLQAIGISPKLEGDTWRVRWYLRDSVPTATPVVKAERNWSDEQKAIFNWFSDGVGHLVVRARAGTGKTTTIKTAFSGAKESKMLYAVFNKKNQTEAASQIFDSRVEIKTLHSVGFMFIQHVWPCAKPTDEVEADRVEEAVGENTAQQVKTQVKRLVGFAKNVFVGIPTMEQMMGLALERDIEAIGFESLENGGWGVEKLCQSAMEVMEISKKEDKQGRISFNDMVWLPVTMGWVRAWYDLVVVDEAQDMNLPQLMMAMGAAKKSGRVCVVGDDRQSIYAFRGAASNGIDMMKEKLQAQELGLTTTYRCPKSVVQIAAGFVPDYKAAETAPEGIVDSIQIGELEAIAQPGNAILSRANAPIMAVCLSLLRRGTPARIEGRDLGKALLEIVSKFKARSVPQFITKVEKWREKQMARYADTRNGEEKCVQISDKADTLLNLAEGVSSVSEIEGRIKNLFSDSGSDSRPCVVLSTVHKAKGLEWTRVFMLSSTFHRKVPMNGPSKSPEAAAAQAREEQNVYYVAVTRAKEHLTMVHGELKRKG